MDTKLFTGETYIGIKVAGDAEMPRQKLTSVAYALQSGGIPRGVIWMWSGNKADIPAGWALCDGSNKTPDLRGKFILGADATRTVNDGCDGQFKCNIGASGGEIAHALTINEMPSHNHGGVTHAESAPHTHYDAGHRHDTVAGYSILGDGTGPNPANLRLDGGGYTLTQIASGKANLGTESATHTHEIPSQGSGAAHNNIPPFYALAFIMKL
jgi:microcystin-dependent protein